MLSLDMRFLRVVLYSVYIILLILLLITRCSNKEDVQEPVANVTVQDPAPVPPVDESDDELIEQAEDVGGNGKLKVTLLWDFPGDIDLYVLQPNGIELYFERKSDPSTGGYLDIDNTSGGRGSAENMYWENPERGVYEIKVHYYDTNVNAPQGGDCSVVIINGNKKDVYRVRMRERGQRECVARVVVP